MIASDTDSFSSHENNNSIGEDFEMSQEEEDIENELDNIEFGKILKVEEKLKKQEQKFEYLKNKNERSFGFLKSKFEQLNKSKSKYNPKVKSALIKPNKLKQFKNKEKSISKSYLSIDPRFINDIDEKEKDKMRGKKRYNFVEEEAKNYLMKIDKLKKNKEIILNKEDIENINKNKNNVKNYLSQIKIKEIDNKLINELKNKGITLNKKEYKLKLKEEINNNRQLDEEKKYVKRKTYKTELKRRKLMNDYK